MKKPIFWEKAKRYLTKKDKKLAAIIKKYPSGFLFTKSDPFYTLARSIVGQQISVKAAESVWLKFEAKLKKVTPNNVCKIHFQSLKACGLSRQKVLYLRELSKAFTEKKIAPKKWKNFSDEEIINELIQVKGIGRWTAEMFLIFNLCRPDIFPVDDIGMIKGICNCYNLKYPLKKENAIKMSMKWKPYRSVATWYFWKSLDPIPVEY